MDLKALVDAEMTEYSNGAYADHGGARDSLTRFAGVVLSTYAQRINVVATKIDCEFGRENGPGSEWLNALANNMCSNTK